MPWREPACRLNGDPIQGGETVSTIETEGGRAKTRGPRMYSRDWREGQPVVSGHGWPPNANPLTLVRR